MVSLSGGPEGTERAAHLLSEFSKLISRGYVPKKVDIPSAIRIVKDDPTASLVDFFENRSVGAALRQVVTPRNVRQQEYLQALAENDLVFAIGPAGTGKTYLAVAMAAAALEMNRTLVRTAHNPLLYEVQDFGLGIVGADGRLWAEAPGIAGFISGLSDTVRSGLQTHGPDGFAEGDVLIVNDPFVTGTHISDTSVYTPIVAEGKLVAFAIVTAHWADIGGKSPGGWAPDTTDVYQEGICFTHQRLDEWWKIDVHLLPPSKSHSRHIESRPLGRCRRPIGCCRVQNSPTIRAIRSREHAC